MKPRSVAVHCGNIAVECASKPRQFNALIPHVRDASLLKTPLSQRARWAHRPTKKSKSGELF
jgi:hypothetical protein